MHHQQNSARLAAVLERSVTDLAFRKRLLADPRATLQAEGLPVPPGADVIVLENTASVANLVIPAAPDRGGLEDAQLDGVSGGAGANHAFTPFPTWWVASGGATNAIFDGGISPGTGITIGGWDQAMRLK